MRKFWAAALACGLLLGSMGVWTITQAAGEAEESHPHLHHARKRLHEAKKHLEEAKHRYHGHRKAAIKDINHALHQIHEALKD